MRYVALSLVIGLGLWTYSLYFVVYSFPLLDRPASFFFLTIMSVIVSLLVLIDSVRKASTGTTIWWNALAIVGAVLLSAINGLVLFLGGLFA